RRRRLRHETLQSPRTRLADQVDRSPNEGAAPRYVAKRKHPTLSGTPPVLCRNELHRSYSERIRSSSGTHAGRWKRAYPRSADEQSLGISWRSDLSDLGYSRAALA